MLETETPTQDLLACCQHCGPRGCSTTHHLPCADCADTSPRERVWCPDCRGRRIVVDRFTAGTMTRAGEVEYGVTALACGHEVQGGERIVAAAPGAPYAGVPVASSHRMRDLRAAGPMWPDLPDE